MYVNKGTVSKILTETSGNGSDYAVMECKGLINYPTGSHQIAEIIIAWLQRG